MRPTSNVVGSEPPRAYSRRCAGSPNQPQPLVNPSCGDWATIWSSWRNLVRPRGQAPLSPCPLELRDVWEAAFGSDRGHGTATRILCSAVVSAVALAAQRRIAAQRGQREHRRDPPGGRHRRLSCVVLTASTLSDDTALVKSGAIAPFDPVFRAASAQGV